MIEKPFPLGDRPLSIGMIGMTEGNGHPYSWSAMFNDYDREAMRQCPFPGIPAYLDKQPKSTIGIAGAKVTHIYCDRREDAESVARASLIEHIVDRPEDLIGSVDAVIIATDIGSEHVRRAKPFIEAGVPLLIDKPMADSETDLDVFLDWHAAGKPFVSSSSMRYTKELEPYYTHRDELGELMYICQPMAKRWEAYGIHALEAIYPLLGPGFETVRNVGDVRRNLVLLEHRSGCDVHIALREGMYGAFGGTLLVGSVGQRYVYTSDSYYAFKKQLDRFVCWLRSREEPQPFSETAELIRMVIAGIRSRDAGGRPIRVADIAPRTDKPDGGTGA